MSPMPKVTIRRLPVLDGPPAKPILDGVRIRMPAGEAVPVWNGGPWRFIAYLELLPGPDTWRGNHWHEKKTEYFYVISGRLRGVFEDLDTGETLDTELEQGTTIVIQPRCAHAFKGLERSQALECSPHEFDATDAFRKQLGSG